MPVPHMESTSPSPDQKVVTTFDSNITLTGPSGRDVPCRAFIPGQDGTLNWKSLAGTNVIWVVTAGQQYNFSIERLVSAGTSGVTSILAIG